MTVAVGVVVAVVGFAATVYGIAMFANYRQVSTWYWETVFKWHERWNPLWRSSIRKPAKLPQVRGL